MNTIFLYIGDVVTFKNLFQFVFIFLSIICPSFSLLVPIFPFLLFVVSTPLTHPVPRDGLFTFCNRSQRMDSKEAFHHNVSSTAVSFMSSPESCSFGTFSQREFQIRDNGQLNRVNNSVFRTILPQRHRRQKKRKEEEQIWYNVAQQQEIKATMHKAESDASHSALLDI